MNNSTDKKKSSTTAKSADMKKSDMKETATKSSPKSAAHSKPTEKS